MPVYWSMMIATAIIGILCYGISSKKVIVEGKENNSSQNWLCGCISCVHCILYWF